MPRPSLMKLHASQRQRELQSSAKARTRLKIKDEVGAPVETQDLVTNDPNGQSFFSDSINVFMNENGLIRLKVQASCRQDDINYATQ